MHKKIYRYIIFILAASLALTACGTATYAQATSEAQPRTLNVTGSGRAYLTPDLAYISIGVHTEDKDAAKAVAANNAQSQEVSQALKSMNIDTKDIQTTNFSIYPQQQYDQNGKLQGIIYTVDNSVYVTLRDLNKIGQLLNAVVEAGANSINGVQFDLSDRTKSLSEARKEAIANAQSQAKEIAEAAGLKLGKIQYINVYSGVPSPVFEGKGGGGGAAMAIEAPISPGQLVLTVEVSMTYLVE